MNLRDQEEKKHRKYAGNFLQGISGGSSDFALEDGWQQRYTENGETIQDVPSLERGELKPIMLKSTKYQV